MTTLPKSCLSSQPWLWASVLGMPDVCCPVGLGAAALRLDGPLFPDAVLACLGHQKERQEKGQGGQRNRIGKRPAQTPGGEISGGRDDRHEAASPPIADVIRHGHGRVANAAREVLSQEGPDGTV